MMTSPRLSQPPSPLCLATPAPLTITAHLPVTTLRPLTLDDGLSLPTTWVWVRTLWRTAPWTPSAVTGEMSQTTANPYCYSWYPLVFERSPKAPRRELVHLESSCDDCSWRNTLVNRQSVWPRPWFRPVSTPNEALLVFDCEVLFLENGNPSIVLRLPVAIYLLLFLLSMVWF